MPIGHFIARSLEDAVHFCTLLDGMLIVLSLWSLNRYDVDERIDEEQTRLTVQLVAASMGLPAALIFKGQRKLHGLGVLLAAGATAVYAFSVCSEWSYSSAVSRLVDSGRVEVSAFFWPTEILQYAFILVLVLNHLFLAQFGRQELRKQLMHNKVPNNGDSGYQYQADEVM